MGNLSAGSPGYEPSMSSKRQILRAGLSQDWRRSGRPYSLYCLSTENFLGNEFTFSGQLQSIWLDRVVNSGPKHGTCTDLDPSAGGQVLAGHSDSETHNEQFGVFQSFQAGCSFG